MIKTPRTDAALLTHLMHNGEPTVDASFARQLERELNETHRMFVSRGDKLVELESELNAARERNLEYFRAEYEITGTSQSAENARKLQAFLNRHHTMRAKP